MRTFQFSGFGGGLGTTLTDLLGPSAGNLTATMSTTTTDSPFVRAPSTGGFQLLLAEPFKATLAIDPAVAAAAAEAARLKAALDDANAALQRARAGNFGTRGGNLMPVKLYQDLQDRLAEAERRSQQAQAMLESVSIGARLGAAFKWALFPVTAGAIVIGMTPPKGKALGVGLVIVGAGLGVFRFFKKAPGVDPSLDAEEE